MEQFKNDFNWNEFKKEYKLKNKDIAFITGVKLQSVDTWTSKVNFRTPNHSAVLLLNNFIKEN